MRDYTVNFEVGEKSYNMRSVYNMSNGVLGVISYGVRNKNN